MRKNFLCGTLILIMSWQSHAENATQVKPSETVDKLFAWVRKDIVGDDQMKEDFSKEKVLFQADREKNLKFHPKLSSQIDFEKLATLSMPQKWQKQYWKSEKDRKILTELLQNLIEEIVYPRAKDFLEKHTVKYQRTEFHKDNSVALIYYLVEYKKKSGEIETIDLMFKVHQKKGEWRLYDIRLEDELWTEMFKNQFNHIITTKSYAVLLEKMQEKLKRVQNGAGF